MATFDTIPMVIKTFMNVFNNIPITIKKPDRTKEEVIVPIEFSAKNRFFAARYADYKKLGNFNLKLPRMGVEWTGLTADKARARNTNIARIEGGHKLYTETPYRMSLQIYMMCNNLWTKAQIIEYIIPAFNPNHTVRVEMIRGDSGTYLTDLDFVLTGVSPEVEFEGEIAEKIKHGATLDFEVPISILRPISSGNLISNISFNENDPGGAWVFDNTIPDIE